LIVKKVSMSEIFGYSVEELENMGVNDITLPEDREVSPLFIRKSVNGEITSDVFEKRYIARNGKTIHGQGSSSLLRDNRGEPIYYISHVRDVTKSKRAEEEREYLIEELRKALSEIKVLKGIIPICSYCKKIRNDKGAWDQMEAYISAHSEAQFSHGMCPECYKKQMEEIDKLQVAEPKAAPDA